ncbi:putative ribonuclease H-like domain-containing protein, partial [Tanacetum coccineum]
VVLLAVTNDAVNSAHVVPAPRAPRNQGNRNKDAPTRIVPIKTPTNALVVQDGIGGYDWSFQAEEDITNFALMAYTSQGSSSSNSEVHTCSKDCLKSYETLQKQYDQQRDALKKSNLEIIGYQLGLESLESRIVVHQKNEAVYDEDMAFLKYEVKVRDNSITELKNQLAEALREKDDLKLKLDNEVFESASDSSVNEIEEQNNQVNDRFKKVKGYHAVPPLYTRNYMPSRPDLFFVGLDDSIYKTNVSETISSVPRIESTASMSSKDSLEQPKTVRPGAPIIEEQAENLRKSQSPGVDEKLEWNNDSETKGWQSQSVLAWVPKEKLISLILRAWYNPDMLYRSRDFLIVDALGYMTGYNKSLPYSLSRTMMVDLLHLQEVLKEFNLFSVLQMGDKKNSVLVTLSTVMSCYNLLDFKLLNESQVLLKVPKQNNMYSFDRKNVDPSGGLTCLFAKAIIDESNLWHRRLGHINFKTMNKLVRGNLVRGLPSKLFENDHSCIACQKGKQHKASCKTMLVSSICHPLQMLHMELFGPTSIRSINHKTYCLVVTDDYRIKREFSVARTPQQNEVVERKNRTLIEAVRTMLSDSLLPTTFWAKAVNTGCYIQSRVLVTKPHNKTSYELLHGNVGFLGFFGGFSINSNAFRVFNTRSRKVKENLHKNFLVNKPNVAGSGPEWLFDIDSLTKSMNYEPVTAGNQTNKHAGIKDNADVVPTQQYILLPLLYDGLQSSKDVVANDAGKKTDEEPAHEGKRNGQEKERGASSKENDQNVQVFKAELDNLLVQQKEGYANSTNRDSTVSPSVSTADGAYDDEDVGAEADLNNLGNTMNVSHIPTTRIHKDHPKDKIIRDINLATQTRRMIKIIEEHAEGSGYIKSRAVLAVLITGASQSKQHDTLVRLPMDIRLKIELENQSVCQPKLGLWYPRDSPFDLEAFSDSDYARASLDMKFTTGAEYVAAANCCGHVLWIQNQMLDYGFNFMNTKIHFDNESIIFIMKNQVFHSKTKHIEIRHHFIGYFYEKKLIQMIKIHTDHNVTDLLIKDFNGTDSGSGPRCQDTILGVAEAQTRFGSVFFLEKPEESDGFEEIIDFLNASYVQYALTVDPTIYTTCIETVLGIFQG